jgi:hypothetical protein
MTQPNNVDWSGSPWIGQFATSQFALWHAGCAWAAKSNWFAGNALAPQTGPSVGSPVENGVEDKPLPPSDT